MLAMTLDNATICRHFFVGMAHSYGIVATNLMLVKQELGNQPKKHCPPGFFSFALRRCAFA